MLKKTVTIIIAAVMICSFAACGTSANTNTSSETKTAVNTPAALSDTDKKIQDTQQKTRTAIQINQKRKILITELELYPMTIQTAVKAEI